MNNKGLLQNLSHQEDLQALLDAGDIETSQWGHNKTKTVDDLWREIVEGETQMQDQPLLRIVPGVVEVIIRQGDCMLIEVKQEFRDGLTRSRNIPPAEKMKPGERYIDAAKRCLDEELNITASNIEIIESTHKTWTEVRDSPSYPGLLTQYTFHTVEARISQLPEDDFYTDEYSQDGTELMLRTYWSWRIVQQGDLT